MNRVVDRQDEHSSDLTFLPEGPQLHISAVLSNLTRLYVDINSIVRPHRNSLCTNLLELSV